MTADLSAIPDELQRRQQWLAYRLEQRDGKVTKVPYMFSGAPASSTDPRTWGTFDDALRARANGFAGAGFAFAAAGPHLGVDLDHVRDPQSGVIEPEARRIIARLASYTEISQSGTGVHIIVSARKPGKRARVGLLEMYDAGRYFVMTGDPLAGTPTTIEERQAEIDTLYAELFPAASPPTNGSRAPGHVDVDDTELLRRMFGASNGPRIEQLWRGDASRYSSQSEADSALCFHLAFWTNADAPRIDALFRQSGLMREKWDTGRGDSTYGAQTIERAIALVREGYSGAGVERARAATRAAREPNVVDDEPDFDPAGPSSSNGRDMPKAKRQTRARAGRDAFPLTDMGNGERFEARHGGDVRYIAVMREWYVWDERRLRLSDSGEVERRAKETVRAMYGEAEAASDAKRRREIASHAQKSEGASRIAAMIALAQSETSIALRAADLDVDPWLFNVANGTLDLRTAELRPHRREDLITKVAPIDYDPEASCPTWLAFLDRILARELELIGFLRRAVGYALTGQTTEQKAMILYGTGANGKSTLLETLRALHGDYARHSDFTTFLLRGDSVRNDIARLRGARLVTATEMQGGRALDEVVIKQLTGGDTVTARQLYAEFFEFRPTFKLFLAANHKPVIRGTDHAIWRRICLLPFNVTIPAAEQDPHLADRLRAELPGILAWAVQGCLEWQQRGLDAPPAVRAATEDYRGEMDTLGDFLEERCVVEAGATVSAKAIYTAYVEWATGAGEKPMAQNSLGMRLAERGFDRGRTADRAKRRHLWRGIRLATDQTLDLP